MPKKNKYCYFRKERKKELLDGRTEVYLANKLGRDRHGISMILNGRISISTLMKKQLMKYSQECGSNKPEKYYFYESETGGRK